MSYNQIIDIVFGCIFAFCSLLVFHFIFFSIVGIFAYKKYPKAKTQRKYGIIIPARNEEKVVGNLIKKI